VSLGIAKEGPKLSAVSFIPSKQMRYNPDTERGITIEQLLAQGRNTLVGLPKPPEREYLWDCTNGQGWVKNPNFIPSLI
jgi:hypothetical protein